MPRQRFSPARKKHWHPVTSSRRVRAFSPPAGDREAPLKALIFDSRYDAYRGGSSSSGCYYGVLRRSRRFADGGREDFEIDGIGVFSPKAMPVDELGVGEVGYVIAHIKRVADAKIGDNPHETARPTPEPCPGFKELKPMVFGRALSVLKDTIYGAARSPGQVCG